MNTDDLPEELARLMATRAEETDEMLANYMAVKGEKFVSAVLFTMEVYRVIAMMAYKDTLSRMLGAPPQMLDVLNQLMLMLTGRVLRTGTLAILGETATETDLEEVRKAGKALADKTLVTSRELPGASAPG